jgi:hypothetical protein
MCSLWPKRKRVTDEALVEAEEAKTEMLITSKYAPLLPASPGSPQRIFGWRLFPGGGGLPQILENTFEGPMLQ